MGDLRKRHQSKRSELSEKWAGQTPIHTRELKLTQTIADVIDDDATVIYDSYSGSIYLTDALQSRFAGQVLGAGPRAVWTRSGRTSDST